MSDINLQSFEPSLGFVDCHYSGCTT